MKPVEWKRQQYTEGKKNKCWRCLCHLPYEMATVDHLKPKSRGGPDRAWNYRLACFRCNFGRGNELLTKAEKRRVYSQSSYDAAKKPEAAPVVKEWLGQAGGL